MELTFSIEEVAAVRLLSAQTVTTQEALGGEIGRLLGELYAAAGGGAGGAPVCVYPEPYDPQRIVAEPGVPYAGPAAEGYAIRELPACRAVVTCVRGEYTQLPEAWFAAMTYLQGEGLEVGGPPYERYRVGMGQAEPDAFETDIVIPLR